MDSRTDEERRGQSDGWALAAAGGGPSPTRIYSALTERIYLRLAEAPVGNGSDRPTGLPTPCGSQQRARGIGSGPGPVSRTVHCTSCY